MGNKWRRPNSARGGFINHIYGLSLILVQIPIYILIWPAASLRKWLLEGNKNPSNRCFGLGEHGTILIIWTIAFFIFPFILVFGILPAMEHKERDVRLSVAYIGVSFQFSLLLVPIGLILRLLYKSRSVRALVIVNPSSQIRFNWENVQIIVLMLIEFIQLSALSLKVYLYHKSNSKISGGIEYLLMGLLSNPPIPFVWAYWISAALLIATMFLFALFRAYHKVLGPNRLMARCRLFLLDKFTGILFMPIVDNLATGMSCKYSLDSDDQVVLRNDPSIICWTEAHYPYAFISLIGLLLFFPSALVFATDRSIAELDRKGRFDPVPLDIKYLPFYDAMLTTILLAVSLIMNLFVDIPWLAFLLFMACIAILLGMNHYLRPRNLRKRGPCCIPVVTYWQKVLYVGVLGCTVFCMIGMGLSDSLVWLVFVLTGIFWIILFISAFVYRRQVKKIKDNSPELSPKEKRRRLLKAVFRAPLTFKSPGKAVPVPSQPAPSTPVASPSPVLPSTPTSTQMNPPTFHATPSQSMSNLLSLSTPETNPPNDSYNNSVSITKPATPPSKTRVRTNTPPLPPLNPTRNRSSESLVGSKRNLTTSPKSTVKPPRPRYKQRISPSISTSSWTSTTSTGKNQLK